MGYLLGVDGGNSKTLAVLMERSGCVVGVGRSGNSNHQGRSIAAAMQQLALAVDAALASAGARPTDVDLAYYALAGADVSDDFALLEPALADLPYGRHFVLNNDTLAALRAGTDNSNAVVVVVGAGTNAAGRNAVGDEIRLPGLGWYSGDWGGGGELGRESIRLVARAHDGRGKATVLTQLLLEQFGLSSVDDLILAIYRRAITGAEMISLAPLVFLAARGGDEVAQDLLRRLAEEVVVTATALLRRLRCLEVEADVVLAGSVFHGEGDILLKTIHRGLVATAPLASVVVPETPPVLGAGFCVMDMAGLPVDAAVRRRALQSYETLMSREAIVR